MIEKITAVYEKMLNELLEKVPFTPFNDKQTREEFTARLQKELGENVEVKCDVENNSPDIIYNYQCLVARVSWIDEKETANNRAKYCDLIFGQPDQIMELQQKFQVII